MYVPSFEDPVSVGSNGEGVCGRCLLVSSVSPLLSPRTLGRAGGGAESEEREGVCVEYVRNWVLVSLPWDAALKLGWRRC